MALKGLVAIAAAWSLFSLLQGIDVSLVSESLRSVSDAYTEACVAGFALFLVQVPDNLQSTIVHLWVLSIAAEVACFDYWRRGFLFNRLSSGYLVPEFERVFQTALIGIFLVALAISLVPFIALVISPYLGERAARSGAWAIKELNRARTHFAQVLLSTFMILSTLIFMNSLLIEI
ncbi:MAG: hypothetical protein AAF583_00110 [Pseudomonadota bacterium]